MERHTPIRFVEQTHTYYGKSDAVYTSATTLVHKYQQPYDAPYWSLYKAIERYVVEQSARPDVWLIFKKERLPLCRKQHGLLQAMMMSTFPPHAKAIFALQQTILSEWDKTRDDSCAFGTDFHAEKEKESYDKGQELLPGNKHHSVNTTTQTAYSFDLAKLHDGYHPELMLYNHDYKLAGQADKVWITTLHGVRYVDIDDWKTNKEIKLDNKFQSMLPPIAHLPDCNFIHYSLQISIYGWLLEQYGYRVRNLSFSHYGKDKQFIKQYKIAYRIEEVQDMINAYRHG